jgi:hypothetical protein
MSASRDGRAPSALLTCTAGVSWPEVTKGAAMVEALVLYFCLD